MGPPYEQVTCSPTMLGTPYTLWCSYCARRGSRKPGRSRRYARQVLGIADGETPAAVKEASAPKKGDLPYWWQVCTPREGFRDPAYIDESLFAATLGGVFAGSARDEYMDPERFLSQTYFTENLTQMVQDIASRMSGGQGPAVTEVQTPFGGGKTHALLTLYHLISSPEKALKVPGVAEALGEARIPQGARVLVFDGQEAGTEPAMKEDGASVNTLWGELAHQVGVSTYQQAGHRLGRAWRGSRQRRLQTGAGGGVPMPDPARRACELSREAAVFQRAAHAEPLPPDGAVPSGDPPASQQRARCLRAHLSAQEQA